MDFKSQSASSIAVTRIDLSPEREAQYKNIYHFDKSGKKSKLSKEERAAGLKPTMKVFCDIPTHVEQIGWLSQRINTLFAVVGYLVSIGGDLQDLEDSDGVAARVKHVNDVVTMMTNQLSDESMKTFKQNMDYRDLLKKSFEGMQQGNTIIKPSTVHEGGKDIYFNGKMGGGIAWGSRDLDFQAPMLDKQNPYFENRYLGDYTTPLSLSLLDVLEKFRNDFTGGGDVATMHQRHFRFFNLNYNFEKWIPRFASAGLDLKPEIMSRLFKNLTITQREVDNMKGFMSGVVAVDPISKVSRNASSPWAKYVNKRGEYAEPNAPAPKNEELFSKEAAICQKDFSFSLCLHIPQDLVSYITQSEDPNNQLFKLNTWSRAWARSYIRPKNAKTKSGEQAVTKVPPFILSPSTLPELSDKRKAAGLPTIDKIGDENSIAVNPNGDLLYLPAKEDFDPEQSRKYESLQEDILRMCFENNLPVPDLANLNLSTEAITAIGDFKFETNDKLNGVKDQLASYEGQLLGYDLDFGLLVYAGAKANTLNTMRLNGTTKPEALAIADILGFDFSGEGESENKKTFRQSMIRMMHATLSSELDEGKIQSGNYFSACLEPLIRTYVHMVGRFPNKIPDLQAVIHQAFKELNITNLLDDPLNNFDRYLNVFNEKGNLHIKLDFGMYEEIITRLVSAAMFNANCTSATPLYNILYKEFGSYQAVTTESQEDPRYFSERDSTMAQFGNLYHHVGGKILEIICRSLASANPKDILTPKEVPELADLKFPDYKFVSMTVMPLAVTLSKYVPNALDIFEQAEEITEGLHADEGFTEEDLKLPGLASGTQMFPHQLSAMGSLNAKPKFAILDISPGGGKTILGIADIMNLIGQGEKIRPLVLCPDHLVTNWCDDMFKVTEGKWNVIPLSSKSTKGWETEDIEMVLENAPINTITVAGLNWLKNHHRQTTVAISNQTISLPERVDMLRKHGYNYIIFDESHKAKKYDPNDRISGVHDAVKMVTTFPAIKYVRLATGTLVPDKVQDIVGQANLLTASIFGTPDYMEREVDLENKEDAPYLIRSKLSQFVSVITKKRKDWAFMLPNPIDSFITCSFGTVKEGEDVESVDDQRKGDMIHYAVYQAVLRDTLGELQKRVGKEDDDESEDEDGEDSVTSGDGELETDENGNVVDGAVTETSMALQTQRLEQLLTDPWGDDDFKQQAKAMGLSKSGGYVPVKLRTIVERLDNHFKVEKYDETQVGSAHSGVIQWERGMRHRELDLVQYEGVTYMARNLDATEGSVGRAEYPTPSEVPPSQDPDRWKPERTGKVLIFCRFTRTVEAVYRALPERYKKVARRFHGQLGKVAKEDKWRNLEDFKDGGSDQVKILIANEQAITEGQNLQIASRIIRVEAPWSPGDYEQATARIFRPDVAAAQLDENGKAGDMAREVIFIDWIMCDGTMEVPKVARLVAKTVQTTKFAEKGNPRYADLAELNLNPISMSIEMLRKVETFEDLMPYFEAKAMLNDIEQREFWEMRKTTVAGMIPIPSAKEHPDFAQLDVAPVSSNVRLKDKKFNYDRFLDWAGDNRDELNETYVEALKGLPVRSPFGTGVIVNARFKYDSKRLKDGSKFDPKAPQSMKQLDKTVASTITIRLADNFKGNGPYKAGDLVTVNPLQCHVATGLSDNDFAAFFKSSKMWATETEKKRVAREKENARAAEAARQSEEQARQREIEKQINAEKRKQARIEARKKNQQQNKPINDGVSEAVKKMPKNGVMGKDANVDMRVKLHVGIYNGFFGIVGELRDPDLASFDKEFNFIDFGKYIYMDLRTYQDFEALADWLEVRETKKGGGWILDKATTLTNLEAILDVFDQSNRDKFSSKLAVKPQQQIPMFLQKKLRKPTGANADKKVRLYPIIMQDRVRVCIDVATSPKVAQAFLRYAPVKGHRGFAGQKAGEWNIHEGMAVFFCQNKTEAKRCLKQILTAGYKITNGKTVLANIEKLKPVRAKGHTL